MHSCRLDILALPSLFEIKAMKMKFVSEEQVLKSGRKPLGIRNSFGSPEILLKRVQEEPNF